MHLWYQWLAGCLVFGVVKGLIALVTGTAVLPRLPPTRIAALTAVVYCVATLLLMVRFTERKPTMVDGVVVTFCLLRLVITTSCFPSVWEVFGLASLLLAWAVYRWWERRAPAGGTPSGPAPERLE